MFIISVKIIAIPLTYPLRPFLMKRRRDLAGCFKQFATLSDSIPSPSVDIRTVAREQNIRIVSSRRQVQFHNDASHKKANRLDF